MGLFDFLRKSDRGELDQGLSKTRENLLGKLKRSVIGKSRVDADVLDELEEILVEADVSVDTTVKIIGHIEERIARDKYMNGDELNQILRDEVSALLLDGTDRPAPDATPFVLLVVGVNGVGKTTTIGKLAHQFKTAGKCVVLGAADTFRAAAIDQLKIWGERAGVPVVAQHMGADPASVAFDTLQSAINQQADVVIIDTAGRLHNKKNLMQELGKVKRVMSRLMPDAPHETLLVLDATTGQNAIEQTRQFMEVTDLNAIALTKLDGTAKGGVIIGICDQFQVPVKYIGIGEKMEQLQMFDKKMFVDALFGGEA